MPVTVSTGESNICVFYRFDFPNGSRLKIAAVPLDDKVSREVLGNVTENYTLIIPLHPRGMAWPFLAGFQPRPSYVTQYLDYDGDLLDLITLLIPELTKIPPADDLLDIAQVWWDVSQEG